MACVLAFNPVHTAFGQSTTPESAGTGADSTKPAARKTQTTTSSDSKTKPASDASISTSKQPTVLPEVTIVGQLDQNRETIVPSLGATVYTINQQEIQDLTAGDNIPFNKLVLRFPGVSQDSAGSGSFHVRDEHGNVQYRINDVLIPEGITSFGSQFDTRFAESVSLITGALPAQYGFRTSGILDIHTKSGALNPGGEVEMYGGSYTTLNPSFQYGGIIGKWNFYFSGSYVQNNLGIENPTSSYNTIHDHTDQYRGFAYLSYVIDDTSRISLIAGEAYNQFQIPNSPDQPAGTDGAGNPFVIPGLTTFNSTQLNESQREQNNFEVLAYQKTLDDLSFQLSFFNTYSSVNFSPDQLGDLYFNGVAGQLSRSVLSNGVEFDSSYAINDNHTLRAGLQLNAQTAGQTANTTVIPEDPVTGAQTGPPFSVYNHDSSYAFSYGWYVQDEWKATEALTLNFGGRFDIYQSDQIFQYQFSPRINAVYKIDKNTTAHAGYARYFTPPPLENIPQGSVNQFVDTTNAATPGLPNDPTQCERANYFDVGITHNFTPEYQVGLDGYFKLASNTIDDGQFGVAPILTAFNYNQGQICGLEFSQSYTKGGFFAYANLSVEQGIGTQVNSSQSVLFDTADYNYIATHYIYLDHSQSYTGSVGVSYNISQIEMKPYMEMICGSGLRTDAVQPDGSVVPNGGSVPAYGTVNLGFTQGFKWAGLDRLTARFDVINVADKVYFLRDGSGVGVAAPQYGQRRSFYGGLSYSF